MLSIQEKFANFAIKLLSTLFCRNLRYIQLFKNTLIKKVNPDFYVRQNQKQILPFSYCAPYFSLCKSNMFLTIASPSPWPDTD